MHGHFSIIGEARAQAVPQVYAYSHCNHLESTQRKQYSPTHVDASAMWTHVDRGEGVKNLIFLDVING